MHLRSSKRYSGRRRRHNVFSLRRLLLWILAPIVIFIGVGVYQNQDTLVPRVNEFVDNLMDSANDRMSTARAPQPTSTPDPTSNLTRAHDAWVRGAIEEALGLYRQIIEYTPNDITTHYRYTLGLIMEDRDDEAVIAAENAVTANPFSPDTWSIRSLALSRSGNYGGAVASALRALELASASAVAENPNMASSRARALAFLAEAYFYNQQYERAFTLAEQAITTYPDSFEAYYVRGLISWIAYIDRLSAIQDFQTAYDLAPNMLYVAVDMSWLDSELQNIDRAIARMESVLELNPSFPRALQWLGNYYLVTVGDPNRAVEYLSRCVRANADIDRCHYQLGRAQMRLEQYTQALASFEAALALNRNDGFYFWWAAEANILLLQTAQAMPYLQQGYQIALNNRNQLLIDSFQSSFQRVGAPVAPVSEPDAEQEDAGS